MDNYLNYLFLGFSLIGVIIVLFMGYNKTSDGSYGRAICYLWFNVYSFICFMYVVFKFSVIKGIDDTNKMDSFLNIIKKVSVTTLPTIFLIILLVWIIVLNIQYYKKINEGQVASDTIHF